MNGICLDYTSFFNNDVCATQGTIDITHLPDKTRAVTYFNVPSFDIKNCINWEDSTEIFLGSKIKHRDYDNIYPSGIEAQLMNFLLDTNAKNDLCAYTIAKNINEILADVAKSFSDRCIDSEFSSLSFKLHYKNQNFSPGNWWHLDTAITTTESTIKDPKYRSQKLLYNNIYRLIITFEGPSTLFCIHKNSRYCQSLDSVYSVENIVFQDEYITTADYGQAALFDAHKTYHTSPKYENTQRAFLLSTIYCLT